MLGEKIRREPHHHLAVFQHIGDARGRAQIVLENVEIVLVDPYHIDAGDLHIDIVRHLEAAHYRQIERIVEDDIGRQKAAFENLLRAIDIGEEHIQRLDALEEAGFEPLPFGAADNARHDIEGDQPLRRVFAAIDGEGNANSSEQKFCLRAAGGKMFRRCFLQPAGDFVIDGACRAIRKRHFVEARPHGPQLGLSNCFSSEDILSKIDASRSMARRALKARSLRRRHRSRVKDR